MRLLRCLSRDDRGTAMVEAALLFPMVLIITFGLIEFGNALWQWNAAEKATAIAARYIATRGPLLTEEVPDCFVATTLSAGTSCEEVPGAAAWTETCSGDGAGPCDAAVLQAALAEAQAFAPFIEPANLVIQLRGSEMGFVGRGDPVPLITVSTTGLTFDFAALGDLIGLDPIPMPGFDATITGEDQDEGEGTP